MDEVRQWQNRPLEALYPILYMDCLQGTGAGEPADHQQGGVPGAGGHDGRP
jgi:hypothetical protein